MGSDREDLAERREAAAGLDRRLLAKLDSGLECALERAEEAAGATSGDLGTRFEAGLTAVLEAAAADPDWARLCLVEAPGLGAPALDRKEAGLQRFVGWLEREAGADGGDPPPALAIEMVVGGVYEVLQRQVRTGSLAELPRLAVGLRQLWLPVLRSR